MGTAAGLTASFVALLIRQLFSWLPASLFLCVMAVFAVFFFIVFLKLISYVLDFVFDFIDFFKPW